MSLDASVNYCTQADVEYVLSVVSVTLHLDDDRSGALTTPETVYLANSLEFATAECNSYIARRYDPTYLAGSSAVREACAVGAAIRVCRHRADPVAESLQEWYDQILEWYEKVRDMKADVANTPERSPARPGIINQRFNVNFPNPCRLQTNQSTVPVGRRPFGNDWWDEAVAGI